MDVYSSNVETMSRILSSFEDQNGYEAKSFLLFFKSLVGGENSTLEDKSTDYTSENIPKKKKIKLSLDDFNEDSNCTDLKLFFNLDLSTQFEILVENFDGDSVKLIYGISRILSIQKFLNTSYFLNQLLERFETKTESKENQDVTILECSKDENFTTGEEGEVIEVDRVESNMSENSFEECVDEIIQLLQLSSNLSDEVRSHFLAKIIKSLSDNQYTSIKHKVSIRVLYFSCLIILSSLVSTSLSKEDFVHYFNYLFQIAHWNITINVETASETNFSEILSKLIQDLERKKPKHLRQRKKHKGIVLCVFKIVLLHIIQKCFVYKSFYDEVHLGSSRIFLYATRNFSKHTLDQSDLIKKIIQMDKDFEKHREPAYAEAFIAFENFFTENIFKDSVLVTSIDRDLRLIERDKKISTTVLESSQLCLVETENFDRFFYHVLFLIRQEQMTISLANKVIGRLLDVFDKSSKQDDNLMLTTKCENGLIHIPVHNQILHYIINLWIAMYYAKHIDKDETNFLLAILMMQVKLFKEEPYQSLSEILPKIELKDFPKNLSRMLSNSYEDIVGFLKARTIRDCGLLQSIYEYEYKKQESDKSIMEECINTIMEDNAKPLSLQELSEVYFKFISK